MQFSVPIRLIEIQETGYHIAVSGFVNGNLTNMLIDTGASQTVFDKNRISLFASDLGLRKSEQLSKGLGTDSMEGYQFTINQFILGDLVIENYEVVALDLMHINASYQELNLSAIDLVLGGDFLKKHSATIDFGRMELVLSL